MALRSSRSEKVQRLLWQTNLVQHQVATRQATPQRDTLLAIPQVTVANMPWESILVIAILLGFAGYLYYSQKKQQPKSESVNTLLTDLTEKAKQGRIAPAFGVDPAIERIMHVLARKQKNNPLLIGNPGVGKTAVVEAFAKKIADKSLPEAFHDKKILSLNLADLLAGTRYRGELEGRLRALLEQLEKNPRENILFIDEIHMIQQARGSEGSLDIADIIKPALSRGDLHIIGATTWDEYQKYIKSDSALERRFQPVLIEEPSRDEAIQILNNAKPSYESYHQVQIDDAAIVAAVDQSIAFIKDRFLPDKALDLIDEASAAVSLESLSPAQTAAFALLHGASKHAVNTCPINERRVTAEHISVIIDQWKLHQQKTQEGS